MRLAEARAYAVDAGTSFLAVVIDNSSTPLEEGLDPNECD